MNTQFCVKLNSCFTVLETAGEKENKFKNFLKTKLSKILLCEINLKKNLKKPFFKHFYLCSKKFSLILRKIKLLKKKQNKNKQKTK